MNKYYEEYRKNRSAHSSVPSLVGFRCPELIEKHRTPYYTAEVAIGIEFNEMSWVERSVSCLNENVFCDYCRSLILCRASEIEVLQNYLEIRLKIQHDLGEEEEPLRIKRGVVTELYYGAEYDELGR